MEKIVNPMNEAELALFKSLFEAEGIRYFVHNENFGSILIGPQISNYNVKTIFVPAEFADQAREIVTDFRQSEVVAESKPNKPDRFRLVVETVVFGWFMPGRRRGKSRLLGHEGDGDTT